MKTPSVYVGAIGAILIVCAGLMAFFTNGNDQVVPQGTSPVGTTFNSAKIAEIVWSLSAITGTSTSILNTDSNDRIVESVIYDCNTVGSSNTAYVGGGLAALLFKIATTSTSAPATLPTTAQFVLATQVSTSSTDLYVASSTPGTTGERVPNRIWASGSYLTFYSNATNTAQCVIAAKYLGT